MRRGGGDGFAAFLAAIFLLLGIVVTYVDGAIFDSASFTNHALDALDDEGVRAEVSTEIANSLVPGGTQGASGGAIANASDRLFDEPAFRTIVRGGVSNVHTAIFKRDSNGVSVALNGVGGPVRDALQQTDPGLAAQISPEGDATIFNGEAPTWLTSAVRTAKSVRFVGIALLGAAALMALVALATSNWRIATIGIFGGSLAIGAVVLIALLLVAKALLGGLIDDPDVKDAFSGVFSAYLGGLQTQLIVLAIAGAAIPIGTRLAHLH